jgi:hypothetical protein
LENFYGIERIRITGAARARARYAARRARARARATPANDEIDVALNYADYYYLEALSRCKALQGAAEVASTEACVRIRGGSRAARAKNVA